MNAAERSLAERIRHALSWREKARQLEHGARDDERLRAFYGVQAVHADKAVARLRLEGRTTIAETGRRLQKAIAAKQSETRITAFRGDIAELNDLLKAENPHDAGGFVDLPLEAYPSALEGRPATVDPWAVFSRRGLLVIVGCLLLGIATVFAYVAMQSGDVDLFVSRPAGLDAPIPVRVVNLGRDALHLTLGESAGGEGLWRIDVLVSPDSAGAFVRLPRVSGAWDMPYAATGTQAPIVLPPGLTANLLFAPAALGAAWDQPVVRIRFELFDPRGTRVAMRDLRWEDPPLPAAMLPEGAPPAPNVP